MSTDIEQPLKSLSWDGPFVRLRSTSCEGQVVGVRDLLSASEPERPPPMANARRFAFDCLELLQSPSPGFTHDLHKRIVNERRRFLQQEQKQATIPYEEVYLSAVETVIKRLTLVPVLLGCVTVAGQMCVTIQTGLSNSQRELLRCITHGGPFISRVEARITTISRCGQEESSIVGKSIDLLSDEVISYSLDPSAEGVHVCARCPLCPKWLTFSQLRNPDGTLSVVESLFHLRKRLASTVAVVAGRECGVPHVS